MTGLRLAVLYAGFGVIATAANLGVQVVLHGLLPPGQGAGVAYWLALAAGTGAGLVIKYVLDKRWIFADPSAGIASHGRMFSLYTLMGVASTGIFWGTQTAFFLATGSLAMLYLGGALGLAVGYWVKYRLDRRFVFTAGTAA